MRQYIIAKYTGAEFYPRQFSARTLRASTIVCSGARRVSAGILRINLTTGSEIFTGNKNAASPYVVFMVGSQTVKSKKLVGTSTPSWNETWMLNVPEVSYLIIQCFHHSYFSRDVLLGEAKLGLACISGGEEHQMGIKLDCGELHCLFQLTLL